MTLAATGPALPLWIVAPPCALLMLILAGYVMALREAGYGEDQLFELVVAAALGASLGRFERGLQVMRAARAGR